MKSSRRHPPIPFRAVVRFLAKGLLLLMLLLGAARAALNEVADREVRESLLSLEKQGFATCLEAMAPPPVAPEENGALVLEEAFAAFEPGDVGMCPFQFLAFMEPEQMAALRVDLDRNVPAMALLRKARTFSKFRFDRDYSRGHAVTASQVRPAMQMAFAASLQAVMHAEEGRQEQARESVLDMLLLAEAFRLDPILNAQELRRNILQDAACTIAACSRGAQSESDLGRWLEILPPPEVLDGALEFTLRGQVAASACFLIDPAGRYPPHFFGRDASLAFASWCAEPFIRLHSIDSLKWLARSLEECRLPYHQASRRAEVHLASRRGGSCLDYLRILQRSPYHWLDAHFLTCAALAVTRAGLEAERFFVRWGRYPEEICVPDPLTGRPLLYDREEGTITTAGTQDGRYPHWMENEGLVWELLPR